MSRNLFALDENLRVGFGGVCCRAAGLTRIASHPQIVPQNNFWEIVVVTGKGSSATSHTGVSTLYTLDGNTGKMVKRGTVDRVCSGNTYYRIGYDGQGPGKIARALSWGRVLNTDEIQQLAKTLTGEVCQGNCTSVSVIITMWPRM